jgi:glycosyltransferase involved in cell wall biosynthesis
MKIAFLHYHHSTHIRGAETFVSELSKALKRKNKVKIFSSSNPLTDSRSEISIAQRFFIDTLSLSIATWTFSQLKPLEDLNPDFVFALNGGWQTLILRVWTFLHRKKLIIPGQSGPGWDDRWNLLWAPDAFICLTRRQLDWAKKAFHWPFTKLINIPNGVNLEEFTPNGPEINLQLTKPVVMIVASSEKAKRVEQTIRAVSALKNASLIWVGAGANSEELELIGTKILGSTRFLHLSLPHSEMPKYYRSVDSFTLCSQSSEAFGLVYLEALASGLPVVATNDQSRKEIVGEAGVFVKNPDDQAEYSKALKDTLGKDWTKMSREQATKFSWETISASYQDLLESFL